MWLSISYIFKGWCSLEIFGWVQTQPGAVKVSASVDELPSALLETAGCLTPSPGSCRHHFHTEGEWRRFLSWHFKESLPPWHLPALNSTDVKTWWWSVCLVPLSLWSWGKLGHSCSSRPEELWAPLPWLLAFSSISASNGSFSYSVLSKGNCQEVRTEFQNEKNSAPGGEAWIGLTSWMVLILLNASCYPCFNSDPPLTYGSQFGCHGPSW